MVIGSGELRFILQAFLAVGLGALIGIEREHRRDKPMVIAGVRTFPMTSLSGLIFSFLAGETGIALIEVGLIIFGGFALLLAFLKYEVHTIGITTPVAFYLTFLIGIMVYLDFFLEATFITVLITSLLLTKQRLHQLAQDLGR